MHTDDNTATVTIQQIRQQYPHLGLQLPEGMADDLAPIDAEKDEPRFTVDPGALRDAVTAARDAGEDPATDEAVRTELARHQLASLNLGPTPAGRAERRAVVLRKYTPAILADLARVVDQADATLAAARKAGVNPAETIPPGMAGRVPMWEQAGDALTRLNQAAKLWGLLVIAFGLAARPQNRRALVIADLTPEQLFALDGRDLLAPARAGHRLALASPDEYTQRCQRIDQHLAEQAARQEREARTGRREAA